MTQQHVNQGWRSWGPVDYVVQDHPGGATVRTLRIYAWSWTLDVQIEHDP